MRTLRFRVVELPYEIECGGKYVIESDQKFPVHFKWPSTSGTAVAHFENFTGTPLKVKVTANGNDTFSSYFGDPVHQTDLDNFNSANFQPQENITNTLFMDMNIPAVAIGSIVSIKVYSPLVGSAFQLELTCT